MMEEVTENNFIFSLTLKLKMLTESGCLPNRHGAAVPPNRQKNKKRGTLKVQNLNFTLNSSTAPIQDKLHSTVSPLPFKICRKTRKT